MEQSVKKAVRIAIGIDLDGRKDMLGMWIEENRNAKFLTTVINGRRNRRMESILSSVRIIWLDLTGLSELPCCIIHQLAQFR